MTRSIPVPISIMLQPFLLERFFAKHEFAAPHLACCSDCEPMHMQEVLALASPEALRQWNSLRLSYTETQGLPELRRAVAAEYFTTTQAQDLVILAPEEGIYLTMRALLSPGDHVIVSYPGYQSLYEVASSMGCSVTRWEPDLNPSEASVRFDVQRLEGLIREDTKMVVVNFPHNPTGTTLSPADWQRLVDMCSSKGCWLFADEMYRMLELDPGTRLPSAADCYPRAISLGGCSKALALPGLRLGWLACRDASLISRVMELKDYTTICSAAPSELLALMAVRASPHIVSRNLDLVRTNVALFQQLVDDFPHLLAWAQPAASSVAFPRLLTGEDIEAFCDRLVESKGVLLLPSTVYGHAPSIAAGHFRIGLGRRDLGQCLQHLREFLRDMPAVHKEDQPLAAPSSC